MWFHDKHGTWVNLFHSRMGKSILITVGNLKEFYAGKIQSAEELVVSYKKASLHVIRHVL